MTNDDKNLRILDAVHHEVALACADDGPDTPELRRDVDAIMAYTRSRLARLRRDELRRADRERARAITPATVRPSILAMARGELIERLTALWTAPPPTVPAHRYFAVMTDDDLRDALEDAVAGAAKSALGRAAPRRRA